MILAILLYHFGTTFGINFVPLGSLLEDFGCTFRVKKQTGAPKDPRDATRNKVTLLDTFWRYFSHMFIFLMHKSAYLKHVVFSLILARIDRF